MRPAHRQLTLSDYLLAENSSHERHEFVDGQVLLMAGGTPRHAYLSTRVVSLLGGISSGDCFALGPDLRIGTSDGLYTYADGSVFCGGVETDDHHTATNPVLLVEVLSDGTREYDRGEKLRRYQTIPSLRHVLLIEPDAPDVTVWSMADGEWSRRVFVEPADEIDLAGLEVRLRVGDIYEGAERLPG